MSSPHNFFPFTDFGNQQKKKFISSGIILPSLFVQEGKKMKINSPTCFVCFLCVLEVVVVMNCVLCCVYSHVCTLKGLKMTSDPLDLAAGNRTGPSVRAARAPDC